MTSVDLMLEEHRLIERMLKTYLRLRQPDESFQRFTTRHDVGRLQELFGENP